ncbi:MAG TPA: rhodanese-like domain-containing protein [Bacillota bacterium]|jgi:rhodanese-related sulfurtransferase|nr:rhodanese-like domain-containing protein [Bacillota bacterium]HQC49326.1 rhodanese-like domain-containing protein [Bacillota bacterium]
MNKNTLLGFALIIVMILSLALPGCQKTSEPSELPYEALHLGNFLFVITKTTEDTKTILHLPVVAHFDEPQDLQVGDVMALAFDQLMESFPPQAVITSSIKLLEEHKAYLASFDLAQQLLEIRPEQTYLIDVRTKEEFEEGNVPNSINIPLDQIESIVDIVPDTDSTLLLYCQSGRRTVTAAKALLNLGYKVIFDLGGILNYVGDLG